ncbi:arylsulfotransferase family protein [Marimonas arenosa]|uniref:Arylsulfotransferase family protein n=1 Tax=Marimonas arenosa TaxID=1795305 RepID=A0AAE4B5U2_9RHOB|nr:arylsulfotransferase family protein [Marimonas arenosa]MDQ2091522.1 arylsulfotransferase family protein [Marimonas arenosa]
MQDKLQAFIRLMSFIVVAFFAGWWVSHSDSALSRHLSETLTRAQSLISKSGWQMLMLGRAAEHVQPARDAGAGVVTNAFGAAGDNLLLVGFFDGENQARVLRRDGTVLHKWGLSFPEHFPKGEPRACQAMHPLDVDIHGVELTPMGELVFNYEYCGTVKLDVCGTPLWTLPLNTHHSITRREAGGYWILGRRVVTGAELNLPPFTGPDTMQDAPFQEDFVLQVGEDGRVANSTSVPRLLIDNGFEALLTADGLRLDGATRTEIVHTNKIAELTRDLAPAYPSFAAGDLAVSMRKLNLIFIFDPSTKQIKWHSTGPWIRQHDPEFSGDGKLSVFNNNAYWYWQDALGHVRPDSPATSNIIEYDLETGAHQIWYGGRPGEELISVIRGQHEVYDDTRLITEFDRGRVIEVDADGRILWEYINRIDDSLVGEITYAARIGPDAPDFASLDCPSP